MDASTPRLQYLLHDNIGYLGRRIGMDSMLNERLLCTLEDAGSVPGGVNASCADAFAAWVARETLGANACT